MAAGVDNQPIGYVYPAKMRATRDLLRHPGMRRHYAVQARKFARGSTWARETDGLVDAYRKAICMAGSGGLVSRLHRGLVRPRFSAG